MIVCFILSFLYDLVIWCSCVLVFVGIICLLLTDY